MIVNTLDMLLNENFSFSSELLADLNLVVVVDASFSSDASFSFPRSIGVIIEHGDSKRTIENVALECLSTPSHCYLCSGYGNYVVDC